MGPDTADLPADFGTATGAVTSAAVAVSGSDSAPRRQCSNLGFSLYVSLIYASLSTDKLRWYHIFQT